MEKQISNCVSIDFFVPELVNMFLEFQNVLLSDSYLITVQRYRVTL